MSTEQQFTNQTASLRAGVAATVMMVIVCFSAALAFSDRNEFAEGGVANASNSAGAELVKVSQEQ